MGDLTRLQDLVLLYRDERDWKQFHNPKDTAISLVLEAGEFLERFQWKNDQEIKTYINDNKVEFSDELADVFYWILIIAHDLDINLPKALESKMAKNIEKYPVLKAKGNRAKYTEL